MSNSRIHFGVALSQKLAMSVLKSSETLIRLWRRPLGEDSLPLKPPL
ncbi:hypothetical protein [Nostoc sp. MG11]|nr:hypothetical protein [Nostoc sp. MG11]